MDEEKKKKLNELYGRRAICRVIINTLESQCAGDPRQKSALAEYNRQMANIEQKITELAAAQTDVVIGLKTAKLFPEVGK